MEWARRQWMDTRIDTGGVTGCNGHAIGTSEIGMDHIGMMGGWGWMQWSQS